MQCFSSLQRFLLWHHNILFFLEHVACLYRVHFRFPLTFFLNSLVRIVLLSVLPLDATETFTDDQLASKTALPTLYFRFLFEGKFPL
jgi:hypothetical protein